MKDTLQAIWRFIMETLFPAFCLECKAEGNFLCDSCLDGIPREPAVFQKIPGCLALDGVLSCSSYRDRSLLARAIHSLKYEYVRDLADPLGRLMAEVLPLDLKGVILCPVPLHVKRLRWRGFNQAGLLANILAEHAEVPIGDLLQRVAFKKPQMELSRKDRLQNVSEVFSVKGNIPPASHVLLVDDVATTGATLESCAVVLKAAGALKVSAIVLARVH